MVLVTRKVKENIITWYVSWQLLLCKNYSLYKRLQKPNIADILVGALCFCLSACLPIYLCVCLSVYLKLKQDGAPGHVDSP